MLLHVRKKLCGLAIPFEGERWVTLQVIMFALMWPRDIKNKMAADFDACARL